MSRHVGDRDLSRGRLWLRGLTEQVGQSFFFVPSAMTLGATVLSQVFVRLDRSRFAAELPAFLETNVESSRSLLAAVAGGTITGASVVFSLTLIAVQVAGSQYSPRVLSGMFEDRFQKTVMGIVIGTFAYALFVLREVRTLTSGDREAFVPQLSIFVALILAVASLLALVASIDHVARGLRVGAVADRIVGDVRETLDRNYARRDSDEETALIINGPQVSPGWTPDLDEESFDGSTRAICAIGSGWVNDISPNAIASALPEGATFHAVVPVGGYIVAESPLGFVEGGASNDGGDLASNIRRAYVIGAARTLSQDVSFGLLQLSDIAVRALSPGVNDPSTAKEIIVRLGDLLIDIHGRDLGPTDIEVDGRRVVSEVPASLDGLIERSFDEIRHAGRTEPAIVSALLSELATIGLEAKRRDRHVDLGPLRAMADRIEAGFDVLTGDDDRHRVTDAANRARGALA